MKRHVKPAGGDFSSSELCSVCGYDREDHDKVVMNVDRWIAWHCPDVSLPDPDREDDPWSERERPSVLLVALFDPYM